MELNHRKPENQKNEYAINKFDLLENRVVSHTSIGELTISEAVNKNIEITAENKKRLESKEPEQQYFNILVLFDNEYKQ